MRTTTRTTLVSAVIAVAIVAAGGTLVAAADEGPGLTWTEVPLDQVPMRLADTGAQIDRTVAQVFWLDDRFILLDGGIGAVSTSTDGIRWEAVGPDDPVRAYDELLTRSQEIAAWQDQMVGWSPDAPGPGAVRVMRPPGEPVTTADFAGAVGTAGIGPAGIVAQVHSALDFDPYITSLLGPGWVEHMTSFDYENGILRITTDDRPALELDWAAQGFLPGDMADRGFGWHSPDGRDWTAIPDFPGNVSEVVGTPDGFIVRGDSHDTGWSMWHSSDGLSWDLIGPATEGDLLPWGDGVLVTDGELRFDLAAADGIRALPTAAESPGPPDGDGVAVGAGPLGVVVLSAGEVDVLPSPDGAGWRSSPLPQEMAEAGGGRREGSVAVGDDSVAVLLWSRAEASTDDPEPAPVPSLWVGTPTP